MTEITEAQLRALLDEALDHGDAAQAHLCAHALAGDPHATHACLTTIQNAQAQDDSETP